MNAESQGIDPSKAAYDVHQDLLHFGYSVIENAVNPAAIELAKRLLNLEIVNWGLTKEQFDEWHQNKTWFPTLREHDVIKRLARFIPKELYGDAELCEPQILCHYPDEAVDWPVEYHLDQEPEWADGRTYVLIAGVALTDNTEQNGGLRVLPPFASPDHFGDPVELKAGDIVVFQPTLWHRSSLNRSGNVRMMVYFRWLEKR